MLVTKEGVTRTKPQHTHGTDKGNILRRKIERRKAKGRVNNFIVGKRIERGERNFG